MDCVGCGCCLGSGSEESGGGGVRVCVCVCVLGVVGNGGGNGMVAGFLGWVGVGPSCGVGLGHLVVVVLVITFGE